MLMQVIATIDKVLLRESESLLQLSELRIGTHRGEQEIGRETVATFCNPEPAIETADRVRKFLANLRRVAGEVNRQG